MCWILIHISYFHKHFFRRLPHPVYYQLSLVSMSIMREAKIANLQHCQSVITTCNTPDLADTIIYTEIIRGYFGGVVDALL